MAKQRATPEEVLVQEILAADIPWEYDRPMSVILLRVGELGGDTIALMNYAQALGLCQFSGGHQAFVVEADALRDALIAREEAKIGHLVDEIVQAGLSWRYDAEEGATYTLAGIAKTRGQEENLRRAEACGLCYEKDGKFYMEEDAEGRKTLYSVLVEPVINGLKQCWNWARLSTDGTGPGIIRFHDEMVAHKPIIQAAKDLGIVVSEVEGRCFIAPSPDLYVKFADVVPKQPFLLTQTQTPEVTPMARMNAILNAPTL